MAEMTKEEVDELAAWPENTAWAPGEKAALTADVRLKYGLDTGADPDGEAAISPYAALVSSSL